MKQRLTYGYDRQSKVPAIAGTTPKLCKTCQSWFAARKREQRCDNCLPANERRRRTVKANYAEVAASGAQRGATARAKASTPKGREMCMELAREAAEHIDYPKGRPQPMSRELKRYYVERAVSAGKQGRCDLDRYIERVVFRDQRKVCHPDGR